MADAALVADGLAVLVDVLVVMAAEAAGIELVADVVGIGPPVHAHVRKEVLAVDLADAVDGLVDRPLSVVVALPFAADQSRMPE